MYGKWHLGFHLPYMPTRFVFEEFRGIVHGDSDHHSRVLTQHGVAFIEKNQRRPFFLYLPRLSIHFPWQGPNGDLASKDMTVQAKAMVEHLVACVGRILAALKRSGILENTLVIFISDNGGYINYEGGHRVPAIVSWPGRIRPGVTDSTAASFDLLPTFAHLAGPDPFHRPRRNQPPPCLL